MSRIMLFLSILIWLSGHETFGQSSKKESNQAFREVKTLDPSEVMKGKHLQYAKPYSIKEFVEYYAEFGRVDLSKKWGRSIIKELYKDSSFVYFGRQAGSGLITFFRVKNDELKDINYGEFDGESMRSRFFEEIVPKSDKQRVEQKSKNQMMGFHFADFKYDYNPGTRLLKVTYKWKVRGDLVTIINKTYTAQYDVNSRQFVQ